MRIKELAREARLNAPYGSDHEGLRDFDYRKFAELIIRECAQVCLEQRDPANLNYKPSEHFAEAVKQHFGVYGV